MMSKTHHSSNFNTVKVIVLLKATTGMVIKRDNECRGVRC